MASKWAMEFAAGPHSHDNMCFEYMKLNWFTDMLNVMKGCQIFELPIISDAASKV
jgi:hypothetical protein